MFSQIGDPPVRDVIDGFINGYPLSIDLGNEFARKKQEEWRAEYGEGWLDNVDIHLFGQEGSPWYDHPAFGMHGRRVDFNGGLYLEDAKHIVDTPKQWMERKEKEKQAKEAEQKAEADRLKADADRERANAEREHEERNKKQQKAAEELKRRQQGAPIQPLPLREGKERYCKVVTGELKPSEAPAPAPASSSSQTKGTKVLVTVEKEKPWEELSDLEKVRKLGQVRLSTLDTIKTLRKEREHVEQDRKEKGPCGIVGGWYAQFEICYTEWMEVLKPDGVKSNGCSGKFSTGMSMEFVDGDIIYKTSVRNTSSFWPGIERVSGSLNVCRRGKCTSQRT